MYDLSFPIASKKLNAILLSGGRKRCVLLRVVTDHGKATKKALVLFLLIISFKRDLLKIVLCLS